MSECNYKDKLTCSKKVNSNIHDGTMLKIKAFKEYTHAWLEKVINFSKNSHRILEYINFVDCMASSGLYFNKKYGDFYDGTAIRVIDIFINSAKKYNNIQFKIYLNDINKQYVKCLNCIKKRKKINIPNNLKIYISNEDKYDFISNIKNMDNFNKYSSKSLIIYDPYEVDFEWRKLEPILQLNADLLITHFFPNDPKRNMKTKNEKLIQRYEHAYEINFNEMKNIFESKKNSFDRNILFRNILHENLKKYSGKKFIAYAPIIIEKKLHVYDIICASYSNYAQELLKNTMYKLYKEAESRISTEKYYQPKLFDFCDEDLYQKDRSEGISEYKFYYDESHIIFMFIAEFGGKTLSKEDFNKRLREHPYLPSNILNLVKKTYQYKIEKKEINGRIVKYYIFPERGF